MILQSILQFILFASVVFWFLELFTLIWFKSKRKNSLHFVSEQPFVSLIKPLCGLEKNLEQNLSSCCELNYSHYEIIFAIQDDQDPAIEIAKLVKEKYPNKKIILSIEKVKQGPNEKINNLSQAYKHSKGEVLIFADSDMQLPKNLITEMLSELQKPQAGLVCSIYRAARPQNIYEAIEALSFNTDFIPSLIFAIQTKASLASPGACQAIYRSTLESIGGLSSLSYFLPEDLELGKRIKKKKLNIHFMSSIIPTEIDLKNFSALFKHLRYWDQNIKNASPLGFFFSLIVKGVPFACLYFALSYPHALFYLSTILLIRLMTAFFYCLLLEAKDSIRFLYLVPLRDLFNLIIWLSAFIQKKVEWRGIFYLVKNGKLHEAVNRQCR